jgi:hypothetical protein
MKTQIIVISAGCFLAGAWLSHSVAPAAIKTAPGQIVKMDAGCNGGDDGGATSRPSHHRPPPPPPGEGGEDGPPPPPPPGQ